MNTFPVNHNIVLRQLQIRTARTADIGALTTMANLALEVLGAQYYTQQQIESSLRYLSPIDQQIIMDGTYFVAEIDQQIVGSGGWSHRRALQTMHDESNISRPQAVLEPATDAARIRAFYVHPDWSGLGIARRLMHLCEQQAQQAGFTRLELLASLTGVALYRRCGFIGSTISVIVLPDATIIPVVKMTKRLFV